MVIPDFARAAIGQSQEENVFRRHAQVAHRRARFLHADGAKVQRLGRSAGMLKVPVAGARVAAGEINHVEGNLILHQGANETHLGSVVVLVRAEHQHGFRKRIDAEFQHVGGKHLDLRHPLFPPRRGRARSPPGGSGNFTSCVSLAPCGIKSTRSVDHLIRPAPFRPEPSSRARTVTWRHAASVGLARENFTVASAPDGNRVWWVSN